MKENTKISETSKSGDSAGMASPPGGGRVAARLKGIGEYYFSQKLREIDELNKQGKNIINLWYWQP